MGRVPREQSTEMFVILNNFQQNFQKNISSFLVQLFTDSIDLNDLNIHSVL